MIFSDLVAWIGIAFCVSQSAMFSGLNLAFFGISRLQLKMEAQTSKQAALVLAMKEDSNFLLATILWGNVGINVLLTLISESVLTGVAAFFFSTVIITFFGEILPQAYFSRNQIRMASALAPILRFYQFLLYFVAKPCGLLLDAWLGKESTVYFRERVLQDMLKLHVEAQGSDVSSVEGIGAQNFLKIDDIPALEEGTSIDAASIIQFPTGDHLPIFPEFTRDISDPFLNAINASGKKWVVCTNCDGEPILALDADGFLRAALFTDRPIAPYDFGHRPIVIAEQTRLGDVIKSMRAAKSSQDEVIQKDVVLWWGDRPKIITGADLFDRLLHGI